eukprot:GFYU01031238.1.p1 GENE.GFYU01031238.1~~GFYU01031238.1.p1  ORF type:complete len:100 (-),score=22.50 GFYU01031238.1:197-496(-)
MDEIAEQLGVMPCVLKLMFTDPLLAYYTLYGVPSPHQYRIHGAGAWDGARDAIREANEIVFPSTTNYARSNPGTIRVAIMFIQNLIGYPLYMLSGLWKP